MPNKVWDEITCPYTNCNSSYFKVLLKDVWCHVHDYFYFQYLDVIYHVSGISGKMYWHAGTSVIFHDDVIKWNHFPCYWPFVQGIHRSSVNSPHIGQWRRALMVSLICAWINGWANNCEACDFRCHCTHYDITVMWTTNWFGALDDWHNSKWKWLFQVLGWQWIFLLFVDLTDL